MRFSYKLTEIKQFKRHFIDRAKQVKNLRLTSLRMPGRKFSSPGPGRSRTTHLTRLAAMRPATFVSRIRPEMKPWIFLDATLREPRWLWPTCEPTQNMYYDEACSDKKQPIPFFPFPYLLSVGHHFFSTKFHASIYIYQTYHRVYFRYLIDVQVSLHQDRAKRWCHNDVLHRVLAREVCVLAWNLNITRSFRMKRI